MAMASTSLERQTLPPAYDGIDSDSSPELVPLTRGIVVQNLLVDSAGKLPMRGPINTSAVPLQVYPDHLPIGYWVSNDSVLVGYQDGTAAGQTGPWRAPYARLVTDTLAKASTAASFVDVPTGTSSSVTVTRDTAPGARSSRLGDYVYGLAHDSSDDPLTVNGSLMRPRALLKWDGTASAPTAVDDAPDGGQDVLGYLNRLWVLGGRDVPSGASDPPLELNTLYYSVVGGPAAADASTSLTAFSASSWKDFDEVTQSRPRTNKIVVGPDDQNDFVVGFAQVAQNLVIFKRRAIYVLSGYDSSNFTVKQFSGSHGCLDNRSIVQWEAGVFFLSEQGYMFFDGATLTNVTDSLRTAIVGKALTTVGDNGVDNAYATATRLPNDYIGLSIGVLPDQVLFCGLYHVPRRAWCTFTSAALPNGVPIGFGRSATIPFMVSGSYLVRCDFITAPSAAPDGIYGVDRILGAFTWALDDDDNTFSGDDDSLENTETNIQMFPEDGGSDFPIVSQWRSRLYNLSSPFVRSKLMRVLLDYTAQVLGGTDNQDGWTVRVLDAQGNELANYIVPTQGDPTAYPLRRRHVQSVLREASEVQLEITWDQPSVPLKTASILGSGIEYEVTNQQVAE